MDEPINKPSENIHFITFNNRKIPVFEEVKNQGYIGYGLKNDLPYYYIDLYKRCPIHAAIINAKVNYIVGGGWSYDKTGVVTTAQKAMAQKILNNPFAEVDLDETSYKTELDNQIFGGYAYKITWSKNKRNFKVEHADFANIRISSDRSKFLYTRGWFTTKRGVRIENKKYRDEKDFVEYEPYDAEKRTGVQILYVTNYHPDQYVYPLPIYAGACTWIENHIKYSDFQYANISKSFSPAKAVNVYGPVPPEEKQTEFKDNIKKQFTGEDGDRMVIGFFQNKETGIEVVDTLVQDQSTLYKEIADQAHFNIFAAHEFPKILLGVATEGALGQRNELIAAEESFFNRYVKPMQRRNEKNINSLASDIGIGIKFKLNRVKSLEWMPDDATISNVLGPDVLRKYVSEKLAIETTLSQKFSAHPDQAKIEMFNDYGVDADLFEVISSRDIPTTDPVELEKFEAQYIQVQFATVSLKQIDRSVLDLLAKDSLMPPANIAAALKTSIGSVRDAIKRLSDRELISPIKETTGGEAVKGYEVAKAGLDELSNTPAKTEKFKVMYYYDVAAGMGEKIIPTTRDFCRDLIKQNRMFTRDEINAISDREGRNVWTLRGGWYHNPNSGVNEPSCRHTWRQVVVKEK